MNIPLVQGKLSDSRNAAKVSEGASPKPRVVFRAELLAFSIHHSDWATQWVADSVAGSISQKTGLQTSVEVDGAEQKKSYSVFLGTFGARHLAEEACVKFFGGR